MSEAKSSPQMKSAQEQVRQSGTDSDAYRQSLFSHLNRPLVRAGFAFVAALVFAVLAYYGFSASKPVGSPFFDTSGSSWLPPLLNRDHEPAYASHDYLPVGPKDQLFHRNRLTKWEAKESLVKELFRNPADNTWRIIAEREKEQPDITIDRLFLSSDRKHLGAISTSNEVYFYEGGNWQPKDTRIRGPLQSIERLDISTSLKGSIHDQAFSPNGQQLAIASSAGVYFLRNDSLVPADGPLSSPALGVAYSTDGTRVVTAHSNGEVRVSDSELSEELLLLQGHEEAVNTAVFNRDSALIASASDDGTVRLWDGASGKEIAVFDNNGNPIRTIEFSQDSSSLLSISEDGTLRIWDLEAKDARVVLGNPKQPVLSAAFSNDGNRVLTTSVDGIAYIQDSRTGETLFELEEQGGIRVAKFSSDGTYIATVSARNAISIWNADSGTRHLFSDKPAPSSVRDDIYALAFSPDNKYVAAVSLNGLLDIWDIASSEKVEALETGLDAYFTRQQVSQNFSPLALSYSPDGGKILLTSSIGDLLIFNLVFQNDQTLKPTALDARSELIFGEDRLQWTEDGKRINVSSFFPVAINTSAELGDTGIRVAVGDEGAIFLGIPDDAAYRPPAASEDVFASLASTGPVGVASKIAWLEVRTPQPEAPSLLAVHFDGSTGIAVGEKGSVLVSHDGGLRWTAGTIGEDHVPTLTDIRVDGAHGYAVAIGRPTFEGAPSHGVLYKTRALPGETADNVGEWKHVPWEAGAPVFSYVSIVLSISALLVCFYYLRKWWVTRGLKDRPIAAGKSDREIGWDDEDVLGLHQLASQVSLFLRNAQTEPPLVLGVAGGWGSGKSSFMNLLCQDLKQRGTSAVWFNAWHHQNEDHLLAALFEAVRTRAIPSVWTWRGLWFRARLIGPRLWAQFLTVFPVALLLALAVVLVAFAVTDDQVQWLQQKFKGFEKTLSTEDGLTMPGMVAMAVPAAGLLYWLRSLWIALPAKPAKLLKNFSSLARIADFQDKLSFRYNFGKAFGEVCSALRMPGVPGLVIFIDDLDRCQASSVLSIFEAVNYFVSVGDCIVVMGFDRAQVEHSIGEELKHIADGIPDKEIPFHFEKGDTTKRRAYARHYMEKLINLEIAIPPMTPEAAAALVQGRPVEAQKPGADDERWLTRLKPRISLGYKVISVALRYACIVALLWAFWIYGGGLYERVAERPALQIEDPQPLSAVPVETGGTATVSAPRTTEEPASSPVSPDQPETGTEIRENPELDGAEPSPRPIEPVWRYEELWILVPVVLLLALAAMWIYLRRAYSIARNVTYDPDSFTDALKDANQVIEGINGTPRAIKRFMNRMRFASARMRKINYSVDFLDLVARWLGWVSRDFERNAESPPQIDDAKVIALGTAEAFMQGLPDPEKIDSDPQQLIDDYLLSRQAEPGVEAVASRVKRLLDEARVQKEHTQIYASMLHSSLTAAPQEKEQMPLASNEQADLSSGFSDQAAE